MGHQGISSDRKIIEKILSEKGSEVNSALKEIYKVNYPIILNFILKNSGSVPEAKDIFQDAVTVFYEKVRNHDLNLTCSIGTYLYSICRNLWLKKLNRKDNHNINIDDIEDYISVNEGVSFQEEVYNILDEVFINLSKICRDVLTAFYFDNKSMKEIMKMTGYKSEQTVKNKKYKCMKELSELIDASPQKRKLKDLLYN